MILKRFLWLMSAVALMVLVLPSPVPAQAQSTQLTQVVATRDGMLSVRVPDGWVSFDGSNDPQIPLFTSQLWFGDSNEALNTRLIYNRTGAGTIVGLGGGAFLTNATLYQESFGSAPTAASLLEVLSDFNREAGFAVDEPVAVTVNGNSGFFTVIDSTSFNDERSLTVTLDTPNWVVLVFTSGTSSTVVDSADLLASIADTLRAPAEQPTTPAAAATPTIAPIITPVAGSGGPSATDYTVSRTISDDQGRISIALPLGWVVENHLEETAEAIVFGDSAAAIETRILDFDQPGGDAVTGVGGWVTFLPMSDLGISSPTPANYAVDLLADISSDYIERGAIILVESVDFEVFGGNTGALLGVEWPSGQTGWIAFFTVDQENLAVLIAASTDSPAAFDTQYVELASLVDTIRVPADIGAEPILPIGEAPPPAENGTQGPGLGDVFKNNNAGNTGSTDTPTNTTPLADGMAIFRTNDGSFSIRLPEGWFSEDRSEFGGGLILGETQEALTTRQDGSDIIERTTPVSGTGVQLLPLSLSEILGDIPVTPTLALDVVNLQVETWTQNGGLVVFPAAEISNINGVQIARAGGIATNGEAGFVAVIISEEADLLLFVAASAESSAAFTEQVFLLEEALASIMVPSE